MAVRRRAHRWAWRTGKQQTRSAVGYFPDLVYRKTRARKETVGEIW